MSRATFLAFGIGVGLVVPAVSSAEAAYTTKTVNLRAGPSIDYPLVMQIPAGLPVEVNGCIGAWTWCDVSFGLDRGWVYAGNLVSLYQDRRFVILHNGPYFHFPIVTFSVGPYWDTYYRGRPWYSSRSYWAHRPPPPYWVHPPGYRPPPPGHRPPVAQPPSARPPRPDVRPPVNRPPPQPKPPHSPGNSPEVARPQPQPVRPAPAKPPGKPRPQQREERKPGGN